MEWPYGFGLVIDWTVCANNSLIRDYTFSDSAITPSFLVTYFLTELIVVIKKANG